MAGRPRKSLGNSFESIFEHLNTLVNQLEDLRAKAIRDYNEIREMTEGKEDKLMLEDNRSNAFKSFENYFKMRIQLLMIHSNLVLKQKAEKDEARRAKLSGNIEEDGVNTGPITEREKLVESLSEDTMSEMRRMAEEIRSKKKSN
jgi:hypothetical protein